MNSDEIRAALDLHAKWLRGEAGGSLANLSWANLSGANLSGADLSPTVALAAAWGAVSDDLCRELMRYDAANHPDPSAFDRWARGDPCPYSDTRWLRVADFTQRAECWSPGPSLSALELLYRLAAEKGVTLTPRPDAPAPASPDRAGVRAESTGSPSDDHPSDGR